MAPELMKGCECTSRIFLFLRESQVSVKETMELLQEESQKLVEDTKAIQELAEATPITIEKIELPSVPVKSMVEQQDVHGKPHVIRVQEKKDPEKAVDEIEEADMESDQEDDTDGLVDGDMEKTVLPVDADGEPVENITILEKGSYELNIESLMAGNPLVIRTERGIFYIRIPTPVNQRNR